MVNDALAPPTPQAARRSPRRLAPDRGTVKRRGGKDRGSNGAHDPRVSVVVGCVIDARESFCSAWARMAISVRESDRDDHRHALGAMMEDTLTQRNRAGSYCGWSHTPIAPFPLEVASSTSAEPRAAWPGRADEPERELSRVTTDARHLASGSPPTQPTKSARCALTPRRSKILHAKVRHRQHEQKALKQINLQLAGVIFDVVGRPGQEDPTHDQRWGMRRP